jgi:hypothetical protein
MSLFNGLFVIVLAGIISETVVKIVRARMGSRGGAREIEDLKAQLEQAQAAIASQGEQIMELQERTDFMERLLAQSKERPGLGTPKSS